MNLECEIRETEDGGVMLIISSNLESGDEEITVVLNNKNRGYYHLILDRKNVENGALHTDCGLWMLAKALIKLDKNIDHKNDSD